MDEVPPSVSAADTTVADGFGRRILDLDSETGDEVELLEFAPEIVEHAGFVAALGERVARFASVRHASYVHLRRLDRPAADRLVLVSDHTQGWRLSDMLEESVSAKLPLDITAVIGLLRQLLAAVALFGRHNRENAIGALSPHRLIVTPQARFVIAEHAFGPAIEKLNFGRDKLWKEFRVTMPPSAGLPRANQRADTNAIGVVALSLLVGRVLDLDEYPNQLQSLVDSVQAYRHGEPSPLSSTFSMWLSRTLQFDVRTSFQSASEAQLAFESVLASDRSYVTTSTALSEWVFRVGTLIDNKRRPPEPPASAREDSGELRRDHADLSAGASAQADASASATDRSLRRDLAEARTTSGASEGGASGREGGPKAEAPPPLAPEPVPEPEPEPEPIAPPPPPPASWAPEPPAHVREESRAPTRQPEPSASARGDSGELRRDPADLSPGASAQAEAAVGRARVEPVRYEPVEEAAAEADEPPAAVESENIPQASASARGDSGELRRDPADLSAGASAQAEAAPGREGGPAPTPALQAQYAPEAPTGAGSRNPLVFVLIGAVAILLGAVGWLAMRDTGGMRAGEGELVVTSRPEGAQVTIDGDVRGQTPLTMRLDSGAHVLEVQSGKSEPRVIPFTIQAGVQTAQYVELQGVALTGALDIRSDPPGARITIDGQSRGTTPMTVSNLTPGDHTVVLEAGGRKATQAVRIEAGITAQLVVPMRR